MGYCVELRQIIPITIILWIVSIHLEQEIDSKNHGYCYIEISEWDSHILRHKHGEKSMKVPFVIYAEIEYLLEKNRHMP